MPRAKSVPKHIDARRNENKPDFSDDDDNLDQTSFLVFNSDVEHEDVREASPKKRRVKHQPLPCSCDVWMCGVCSVCDDFKSYKKKLSSSSGMEHFQKLNTVVLPLNDKLGDCKDAAMYMVNHTFIILVDQKPIYHVHLTVATSSMFMSALKAMSIKIDVNVITQESIEVSFYVACNGTGIAPGLLQWVAPQDNPYGSWHWYGEEESFYLSNSAYLSSFSNDWLSDNHVLDAVSVELMESGVRSPLRIYQLQGVLWLWNMLVVRSQAVSNDTVDFGTIQLSSSPPLFYNEVYQRLSSQVSQFSNTTVPNMSCILADEMGMGKSLQVLSFLMLLKLRRMKRIFAECTATLTSSSDIIQFLSEHSESDGNDSKRQRRKRFIDAEIEDLRPCYCGSCELLKDDIGWVLCSSCKRFRHIRCAGYAGLDEVKELDAFVCLSCATLYHFHHPIVSSATLIIMPNTLINQWLNEIKKHSSPAAALKVFVYKVPKRQVDWQKLTPQVLASYDIILISFKALRACFHESDLDWTTVQRDKKYDLFPPPLLSVEFSLVVIDETQNIEGAAESQILKMALKLRTRRRMSVSGTPFGSGTVRDLFHLAQFLQLSPFEAGDKSINRWADFFERPVMPISLQQRLHWLHDLFAPYILRRTKDMVREQLGITQRFTVIRSMQLSSFEMKLYQDNMEAVNKELRDRQVNDQFHELGKNKIELIRKGCCHPQIFDKSLRLRSNLAVSSTMSIDQVMIIKVEQTKVRCEEAQRELLFYLFKLAGLRLLKSSTEENLIESQAQQLLAVSTYGFALRLIESHRIPCSSYSLYQLQGDESFVSPYAIVPCSASLQLHWSLDEHMKYPFNRSSSGSLDFLSHFSWVDDFWTTPPPITNDTTVRPFELVADWSPHVKLSLVQKKTLLGFQAQTLSRKDLLSTVESTSAPVVVVVFPAQLSLQASEFQDTFITVMSRRVPPDSLCGNYSYPVFAGPTVEQSVYRSGKNYRCRNWRVCVDSLQSIALLVRKRAEKDDPTINASRYDYCWISTQSLTTSVTSSSSSASSSLRSSLISTSEVEIKLAVSISFEETVFDTDVLQELHLQHNMSEALLQLSAMHSLSIETRNLETSISVANSNQEGSSSVLPSAVPEALMSFVSSVSNLAQLETVPRDVVHASWANVVSSTVPGEAETQSKFHQMWRHSHDRKDIIEKDYLGGALDRRNLAYLKLREAQEKVDSLEEEIRNLMAGRNGSRSRTWWMNVLEELRGHLPFLVEVQETVERGEEAYARFQNISETSGLAYLLGKEFDGLCLARKKALQGVQKLDLTPTDQDITQATYCQQCRAYFQRTGPVCPHCSMFNLAIDPYRRKYLVAARRRVTHVVGNNNSGKKRNISNVTGTSEDLFAHLAAIEPAVDTKQKDEGMVEGAYLVFMRLLKKHIPRTSEFHVAYQELAKLEIQWIDAITVESQALVALWDRYSELLQTYDELGQCTSRVQLAMDLQEKRNAAEEGGAERFLVGELDAECREALHGAISAEVQLRSAKSSLQFFKQQVQQGVQEQKSQEQAHQDEACGICKESLWGDVNQGVDAEHHTEDDDLVVLPCAHRFHRVCAYQWVMVHRKCPYCRSSAPPQLLTMVQPRTLLNNPKRSEQQPHTLATVTRIDGSGHAETFVDTRFPRALQRIRGRWGTKIDALLADLTVLLAENGEEKALVFSQWTEMLEIVADALKANDIRYTTCFNRTKDFESASTGIERFRYDADVRVLLLPLHLGAEGLDLVIASHIFLLEPLLDYSVEQQAINRVDRIGQQRTTYVHKYLLTNTIEERIAALQERHRLEETDDLIPLDDEEDNAKAGAGMIVDGDGAMDDDIEEGCRTPTPTIPAQPHTPTSSATAAATATKTRSAPTSKRSVTDRTRGHSNHVNKKRNKSDAFLLDVADVHYILNLSAASDAGSVLHTVEPDN